MDEAINLSSTKTEFSDLVDDLDIDGEVEEEEEEDNGHQFDHEYEDEQIESENELDDESKNFGVVQNLERIDTEQQELGSENGDGDLEIEEEEEEEIVLKIADDDRDEYESSNTTNKILKDQSSMQDLLPGIVTPKTFIPKVEDLKLHHARRKGVPKRLDTSHRDNHVKIAKQRIVINNNNNNHSNTNHGNGISTCDYRLNKNEEDEDRENEHIKKQQQNGHHQKYFIHITNYDDENGNLEYENGGSLDDIDDIVKNVLQSIIETVHKKSKQQQIKKLPVQQQPHQKIKESKTVQKEEESQLTIDRRKMLLMLAAAATTPSTKEKPINKQNVVKNYGQSSFVKQEKLNQNQQQSSINNHTSKSSNQKTNSNTPLLSTFKQLMNFNQQSQDQQKLKLQHQILKHQTEERQKYKQTQPQNFPQPQAKRQKTSSTNSAATTFNAQQNTQILWEMAHQLMLASNPTPLADETPFSSILKSQLLGQQQPPVNKVGRPPKQQQQTGTNLASMRSSTNVPNGKHPSSSSSSKQQQQQQQQQQQSQTVKKQTSPPDCSALFKSTTNSSPPPSSSSSSFDPLRGFAPRRRGRPPKYVTERSHLSDVLKSASATNDPTALSAAFFAAMSGTSSSATDHENQQQHQSYEQLLNAMSSDRSTSSTLDLLSTFAAKSSNGSRQSSSSSSLSAFQSLLNSESLKTSTSHSTRNGVPASLLKHSGHSRSHHQNATQAQTQSTTHWTPPKTTVTSPISLSGNDIQQPKKRGPGRPPKNHTLLMTAPPTTHAQQQSKSKNPPTMVPSPFNQHLHAALALANSKLNSDVRK